MTRKVFFLILLLTGYDVAIAQDVLPDFKTFILQVQTYHPTIKGEMLTVEQAEKGILRARGGFDPKVEVAAAGKQYKSGSYYDYNQFSLNAPTVLGMEVFGGYETNEGIYLNPESRTPDNGLVFSGLSVNLGKGLFMDERRKGLNLAKNALEQAENELDITANNLTYKASAAYWDYYYRVQQREIIRNFVDNAKVRFEALKDSYLNGDIPAIDTVEAYMQWRSRILSLQEADIYVQKSYYMLSNFLWDEGGHQEIECCPVVPDQQVENLVSSLSLEPLTVLREDIRQFHPELLAYDQKAIALNIEQRWYRENLKPALKLKYQFLNEPVGNSYVSGFNFNDYSWGVEFQMPLFLRKERASLSIGNLKIEENKIDRELKLNQLTNAFEAYLAELETLTDQIDVVSENTRLAERLVEAERIKFSLGESSLFLINSRENQLISYQIKLQESLIKTLLSYYSVLWSSGKMASAL